MEDGFCNQGFKTVHCELLVRKNCDLLPSHLLACFCKINHHFRAAPHSCNRAHEQLTLVNSVSTISWNLQTISWMDMDIFGSSTYMVYQCFTLS